MAQSRIVRTDFNLTFWGLPTYLHLTCTLQLLTCMDSLTIENTGGKPVVVIGATNRPNDLDSALRRAGRFDREICLGVPDLAARARILQVVQTATNAVTVVYINRRTLLSFGLRLFVVPGLWHLSTRVHMSYTAVVECI